MVILDIQKQHTTIYTMDKNGLHKQSFFGDLSELSTIYTPTDEETIILLSESYCHLRTYTMRITAHAPFTIGEYKTLLAEKEKLFLMETKVAPDTQQHLLYSTEGIRQQSLAAYLGQTGQIDLHRCIYAPYTHIILDLERTR